MPGRSEMTALRLWHLDGLELLPGFDALCAEEQAPTDHIENVVCDWALALSRPMSVGVHKAALTAFEMIRAAFPDQVAWAIEELGELIPRDVRQHFEDLP